MMDDEILALRLQELELTEEARRREFQRVKDEEMARLLAQQFLQEEQQSQNSNSSSLLIQTGQKASIRLHNPATGSLIGEIFDCRYIDQHTMAFELKQRPGLRLRISDKGKVEFSEALDHTTLFSIELISPTGPMYIICKAHASKINVNSEPIWYLSLSSDNHLIGNGSRSPRSQWVLVAAGDDGNRPTNPKLPGYQSVLPSNFKSNLDTLASSSTTTTTNINSTRFGVASGGFGASAVSSPVAPPAPLKKPEYDRDESTIALLMQWLGSPPGQLYLSELSVSARTMYADGTLRRILYRPDWPIVAERWKDYALLTYPVNRSFAEQYITKPLRQQFFETGYCVIQDVIRPDLLLNARKLALFWAGRYAQDRVLLPCDERAGFKTGLVGPFSTDCDFMALFYESPIVQIVEVLIGEGECTAPQLAEVCVSYPSLLEPPPTLDGAGWVVEGFTETGDHSPYTLLVGVALTDFDAFCGNICVFPTSHSLLREFAVQQVYGRGTSFSIPVPSPQKPFLSNCAQIVLKAGDVFLCTQKLAKQDVANCSDVPTAIVYFKINNINHEFLKAGAMDNVWLEFKAAAEFAEPSPPRGYPPQSSPQHGYPPQQGSPQQHGYPSERPFFPEEHPPYPAHHGYPQQQQYGRPQQQGDWGGYGSSGPPQPPLERYNSSQSLQQQYLPPNGSPGYRMP